MQVDMQRGKQTRAEKQRENRRCKAQNQNKGLAACIRVKACVGSDKTRKVTSKTKSALKNWIQPTVSVGCSYDLRLMLDVGSDSVQHRQEGDNRKHAVENHAF